MTLNIVKHPLDTIDSIKEYADQNSLHIREFKIDVNFQMNVNLLRLFDNNDFHFRRDIMATILAHLQVWKSTKEDPTIVIDSTVVLDENFTFDFHGHNEDIIIFTQTEEIESLNFYVLNESGRKKLLNHVQKNGIRGQLHTLIDCLNKKIVKVPFRLKRKMNRSINFKEYEGYDFFSMLDSHGFDLKCVGQKPLDELKALADANPDCVGFNTMGWLKKSVRPTNHLNHLYGAINMHDGIYVKDSNRILAEKKAKIMNRVDRSADLTFTVTTCKRWDLFKRSMDRLLLMCSDIDYVTEWLCVDDNSSDEERNLMMQEYPFFNFIMKDVKDKGHPKSMNIIWETVETAYAFHFEDDWLCNKPFSIRPLLDYIKDGNTDHLILRRVSISDHILREHIDGIPVYEYVYNHKSAYKPRLNREYDTRLNIECTYSENEYWWWPGLSLNPSIFNIRLLRERIGLFNEEIMSELFEYDYAMRCFMDGIRVHYCNQNIEHIGHVSSYSLNDMRRYYDK